MDDFGAVGLRPSLKRLSDSVGARSEASNGLRAVHGFFEDEARLRLERTPMASRALLKIVNNVLGNVPD